jgi:hypothetical protein
VPGHKRKDANPNYSIRPIGTCNRTPALAGTLGQHNRRPSIGD